MAAGTSFARSGRWEEAIAAYAAAEKQLSGSLRARCLYYLAQANLAAGNKLEHKRVCQQLATDFDLDTNESATYWLVSASVLNPEALEDWTILLSGSENHKFQGWIRGALLFRAGDHRGALALFPKTRANFSAPSLAIIAMAEFRAGNHDAARSALQECEKRLSELTSGKLYTNDWHGLLESRLLYEEAKQLIAGKSP
jgi:tetratricopeptide (TPR) repeat protein